ncbi:MAG: tRNA dihydrouridine synthase DusB [Candidatus Thioglobus sp. MED-G23]|nr:MAG: tRNA dihydrouridine synthase DusB [Candidatus Thioglobus sp. MED-G23]
MTETAASKNTDAALQIGHLALKGRVIAAPMAGVSDQPYRTLARHFGAALAVSEMVSASPELRESRKSRQRTNHDGEAGPVSVQLLGADPEQMADAARFNIAKGADIIDINLGCPTKKVCKRLVGSALMRDELLVGRILEAVVSASTVPVTLKMRTGWDRQSKNAPAIAKMAEEAGIQALSVHGRSRECRYHGPIDYETIAKVKSSVSIPVIANGDIDSPDTALQVLRTTGADAVMVGRAAQGQPWLLGRIANSLDRHRDPGDPVLADKCRTVLDHLEALYGFYGEGQGVRIARKHVQWYAEKLNAKHLLDRRCSETIDPVAQINWVECFFERVAAQEPGHA